MCRFHYFYNAATVHNPVSQRQHCSKLGIVEERVVAVALELRQRAPDMPGSSTFLLDSEGIDRRHSPISNRGTLVPVYLRTSSTQRGRLRKDDRFVMSYTMITPLALR